MDRKRDWTKFNAVELPPKLPVGGLEKSSGSDILQKLTHFRNQVRPPPRFICQEGISHEEIYRVPVTRGGRENLLPEDRLHRAGAPRRRSRQQDISSRAPLQDDFGRQAGAPADPEEKPPGVRHGRPLGQDGPERLRHLEADEQQRLLERRRLQDEH